MPENVETLSLKLGQHNQILDQYRATIYNLELRMTLFNKMLEEKGVLAEGEFEKRWPQFLKNEVGIIGPDGIMEGSLAIKFYGTD